ncbi:MAG: MBL fold metallo-hydrolase [Thermoplasmata archaeon]|nr:MBL fold metallo-hydrolase [Thermoplasmata archaeon]MCI4359844.1 MBL fold metallo-hydrolase [Thermoplasmata archaeon]
MTGTRSSPAGARRSGGSHPVRAVKSRVRLLRPAPLTTPEELRRLLDSGPGPVLLDVRTPAERVLARLPDDRWIPLEELPSRIGELPRSRPVVVYDHLGSRATRAVELLRAGPRAPVTALEGGLDAYSRRVDPTIPRYRPDPGDPQVLVQFPRPGTGCLSYLIADRDSGGALMIDPGLHVTPYRRMARTHGWTIRGIIETHTHADHLAGHAELHAKTGAPIGVSHRSPAQYPHRALSEGDAVEFGRLELVVAETPGHTRDHLMLQIGDQAFTGDTLLPGACGRTDLGDGSPDLLWESFETKVLTLPDSVEVLPAHYGPRQGLPPPCRFSTTIGVERATNEALQLRSLVEFRRYMTEGWPAKPKDFDTIVRTNLAR